MLEHVAYEYKIFIKRFEKEIPCSKKNNRLNFNSEKSINKMICIKICKMMHKEYYEWEIRENAKIHKRYIKISFKTIELINL